MAEKYLPFASTASTELPILAEKSVSSCAKEKWQATRAIRALDFISKLKNESSVYNPSLYLANIIRFKEAVDGSQDSRVSKV